MGKQLLFSKGKYVFVNAGVWRGPWEESQPGNQTNIFGKAVGLAGRLWRQPSLGALWEMGKKVALM